MRSLRSRTAVSDRAVILPLGRRGVSNIALESLSVGESGLEYGGLEYGGLPCGSRDFLNDICEKALPLLADSCIVALRRSRSCRETRLCSRRRFGGFRLLVRPLSWE